MVQIIGFTFNAGSAACKAVYTSVFNRTEFVAQAIIYALSLVNQSVGNACHLIWAYGGRLIARIQLAFAREDVKALKELLAKEQEKANAFEARALNAEKEIEANQEKLDSLQIKASRFEQDYGTVWIQLTAMTALCALIWQAQSTETGVSNIANGFLDTERSARLIAQTENDALKAQNRELTRLLSTQRARLPKPIESRDGKSQSIVALIPLVQASLQRLSGQTSEDDLETQADIVNLQDFLTLLGA